MNLKDFIEAIHKIEDDITLSHQGKHMARLFLLDKNFPEVHRWGLASKLYDEYRTFGSLSGRKLTDTI